MFDLHDIDVAYGDTPVLQGLTLRIEAGEKVAIIGPSGAGKSTLLRRLYQGHGQRCAFVHQDFALVPQLSVYHNVCAGRLDRNGAAYNLFNLLRPRPAEVERVGDVLRGVGLEDRLFDKVHTLSGGQQQRVAVARALYRGAEAILGDEPVASVDPRLADSVLHRLLGGAATVVLSLHDVERALDLCDRVVGLRAGRVAFDRPNAGVDRQALEALYRA